MATISKVNKLFTLCKPNSKSHDMRTDKTTLLGSNWNVHNKVIVLLTRLKKEAHNCNVSKFENYCYLIQDTFVSHYYHYGKHCVSSIKASINATWKKALYNNNTYLQQRLDYLHTIVLIVHIVCWEMCDKILHDYKP